MNSRLEQITGYAAGARGVQARFTRNSADGDAGPLSVSFGGYLVDLP